jgi:flagellar hook-associated protein 2
VLTESLSGISAGSVSLLSQIGISFERDGGLALNSTRLTETLSADPDAVAALFASVGRPTDSLVRFVSSNEDTRPGRYAVDVTQLATRGKLAGAVPAGLTITAGVNDQLTLTVDGISATLTLAPGTYTAASLAAQLQAVINGASTLTAEGVGVLVTETGGVLTITSTRYGAASSVTAIGNAAQGLLGAAPVATDGADVAGTIDGTTASGSGQVLTGVAGDAQGLRLEVSGGTTGARGSVDFSRGYAWRLESFLTDLLSSAGALRSRTDGINRSIEELGRQRETLDRRMEGIEQRYRAQFAALDTLIARMNTTSSFLTQQLARLPVPGQQKS